MGAFNNMFKFGVDDFDVQNEDAILVGSEALPVTCVRVDPRKSIIDGTDVPAGTPDLRWVGGRPVVSSLKGDQILVDNDFGSPDWLRTGTTFSSDKLGETSATSRHSIQTVAGDLFSTTIGSQYTISARLKRRERSHLVIRFSGSGFANQGVNIDISTCTLGTEWNSPDRVAIRKLGDDCIVEVTATADSTSTGGIYIAIGESAPLDFNGAIYTGITGYGIELIQARCVKSSAPAAGFPDLSPALTDYLKDVLTFLHTYTATATIQFTITTYGWSEDENPEAAECVLFESGAFRLKLTAAGFIEIDGTAVSTKKLTADTLSVITVKYDGVNHTLQVDGETPVVVASAIIPSGTSYVGNTAAGDKPSHALHHIAITDDKILTAEEITIGEDGYQVRLGGIVLF